MTTLFYLRFSSSRQSRGMSIVRQMSLLDSYRLQYGLPAPTRIYQDLGVSAFTGSNLLGELGDLINDLKTGVYKTPVTLLVESLDRLSRGEVQDASALIQQQLQPYCTLVTVIDGHRYEQGKYDLLGMITVLIKASLAREESEKKSLRSIKSHERAKELGKRQNSISKRWLRVSEDKRTLHVIEEEAEVIRELFRLKRLGYGLSHPLI